MQQCNPDVAFPAQCSEDTNTRDSDKCSLPQQEAFLFLSFTIIQDLCQLKMLYF